MTRSVTARQRSACKVGVTSSSSEFTYELSGEVSFMLTPSIFFIFYFSPSTRVHVVPFTGGLLLLLKATGAAREPTPRPFTTVEEPIPRTGRHWDLNPVPLDLQTNALPTELTGRPHGFYERGGLFNPLMPRYISTHRKNSTS